MTNPKFISSDILQEVICSECLQFLTVLPITVNEHGEAICGRHKNSSGVNSLLNTVMENYMFKCINHFEGCEMMLDVSTSEQHEQECKFRPHECFFCSFKGNWSQILQHSSQEHAPNVTKDCKLNFQIGQELCETFLYAGDDRLYLCTLDVTIEKFSLAISAVAGYDFNINECELKFSQVSNFENEEISIVDYSSVDCKSKNYEKNIGELIFHFGLNTLLCCQILWKPVELSEKALQLEKRFSLYSDKILALIEREKLLNKINLSIVQKNQSLEQELTKHREQKIAWELELAKHKLSIVNLNGNINQQTQTVEGLSNLVKKLAPTQFRCSQCEANVEETLYLCPQNHCCCKTCLPKNFCTICKDIGQFTNFPEFSEITVSCDWKRCKKSVILSSYLYHKSYCICRPYKCPVNECLYVVYSSPNLIKHWHYNGSPLRLEEVLEFNEFGNYNCYWLIYNDLYHVIVQFQDTRLTVIVEENNVLPHPLTFSVQGTHKKKSYELNGKYISGKYIVKNTEYYYTSISIYL